MPLPVQFRISAVLLIVYALYLAVTLRRRRECSAASSPSTRDPGPFTRLIGWLDGLGPGGRIALTLSFVALGFLLGAVLDVAE